MRLTVLKALALIYKYKNVYVDNQILEDLSYALAIQEKIAERIGALCQKLYFKRSSF